MTGDHMMSRLLQGDVGSGKTIVAFLSMYQAALCHYQSALMAPTEVLASQHYQSFTELSERYPVSYTHLDVYKRQILQRKVRMISHQ